MSLKANLAAALILAASTAASAAVFDEPTKPAMADGAEVLVPASAVASPAGFSGEAYALQFKKADGQELSEFSSRCSAYNPRSTDWRQASQGTLNAKTLFEEGNTKAVASFCKVGGKELGFLAIFKMQADGTSKATTLAESIAIRPRGAKGRPLTQERAGFPTLSFPSRQASLALAPLPSLPLEEGLGGLPAFGGIALAGLGGGFHFRRLPHFVGLAELVEGNLESIRRQDRVISVCGAARETRQVALGPGA